MPDKPDKFKLAVNYAYYENPGMLDKHIVEWAFYSESLREKIEFLVTDDCSSKFPAKDVLLDGIPGVNLSGFRITRKVPWNFLAARNIGAFNSKATWLLTTDMDLMLTADNAQLLIDEIESGRLNPEAYYRLNRLIMPDLQPYKDHPDTWFMSRQHYWEIGGNDEEFAGRYGTDGAYRNLVEAKSPGGGFKLDGVSLHYFPRGLYPDSGTNDLPRKEGRTRENDVKFYERVREKRLKGIPPLTMSFPYERTL